MTVAWGWGLGTVHGDVSSDAWGTGGAFYSCSVVLGKRNEIQGIDFWNPPQ